jgi:hypothetical protein
MSNTVAIMQPYAFPYIGYFCLAEASDVFVFHDDVNYIKGGWINRNRIVINGAPYLFSIPVSRWESDDFIMNVRIQSIIDFRRKFLRQLELAYRNAPSFEIGLSYVDDVLNSSHISISELAIHSIVRLYKLVGLPKTFLRSSERFSGLRGVGRSEKLTAITKALGSNNYVNPIGGTALYDKTSFAEMGVSLSFVKSKLTEYRQVGAREFIPSMSIIDVLMNNDLDRVRMLMKDYELV